MRARAERAFVVPWADHHQSVAMAPVFAAIPAQQVPFYDGCEPTGAQGHDSYFGDWMIYAMKARSFHASEVVEAMTWFDLPADQEAAYDAPFPSRTYMAGPRVFPSLVNEIPGTTDEAWAGLSSFEKPFVTIWSANDPGGLGSCKAQNDLACSVRGAEGQPHTRLAEASHFLQDDQGPAIAERLVAFMQDDTSTVGNYDPACELPVAADGTGTLCTEDANCSALVANTCIMPSGSAIGFCSVEGCTAASCADRYVCCHDCNPAVAPLLPFEGSACFLADHTTQLTGAAGCTCD